MRDRPGFPRAAELDFWRLIGAGWSRPSGNWHERRSPGRGFPSPSSSEAPRSPCWCANPATLAATRSGTRSPTRSHCDDANPPTGGGGARRGPGAISLISQGFCTPEDFGPGNVRRTYRQVVHRLARYAGIQGVTEMAIYVSSSAGKRRFPVTGGVSHRA